MSNRNYSNLRIPSRDVIPDSRCDLELATKEDVEAAWKGLKHTINDLFLAVEPPKYFMGNIFQIDDKPYKIIAICKNDCWRADLKHEDDIKRNLSLEHVVENYKSINN